MTNGKEDVRNFLNWLTESPDNVDIYQADPEGTLQQHGITDPKLIEYVMKGDKTGIESKTSGRTIGPLWFVK